MLRRSVPQFPLNFRDFRIKWRNATPGFVQQRGETKVVRNRKQRVLSSLFNLKILHPSVKRPLKTWWIFITNIHSIITVEQYYNNLYTLCIEFASLLSYRFVCDDISLSIASARRFGMLICFFFIVCNTSFALHRDRYSWYLIGSIVMFG